MVSTRDSKPRLRSETVKSDTSADYTPPAGCRRRHSRRTTTKTPNYTEQPEDEEIGYELDDADDPHTPRTSNVRTSHHTARRTAAVVEDASVDGDGLNDNDLDDDDHVHDDHSHDGRAEDGHGDDSVSDAEFIASEHTSPTQPERKLVQLPNGSFLKMPTEKRHLQQRNSLNRNVPVEIVPDPGRNAVQNDVDVVENNDDDDDDNEPLGVGHFDNSLHTSQPQRVRAANVPSSHAENSPVQYADTAPNDLTDSATNGGPITTYADHMKTDAGASDKDIDDANESIMDDEEDHAVSIPRRRAPTENAITAAKSPKKRRAVRRTVQDDDDDDDDGDDGDDDGDDDDDLADDVIVTDDVKNERCEKDADADDVDNIHSLDTSDDEGESNDDDGNQDFTPGRGTKTVRNGVSLRLPLSERAGAARITRRSSRKSKPPERDSPPLSFSKTRRKRTDLEHAPETRHKRRQRGADDPMTGDDGLSPTRRTKRAKYNSDDGNTQDAEYGIHTRSRGKNGVQRIRESDEAPQSRMTTRHSLMAALDRDGERKHLPDRRTANGEIEGERTLRSRRRNEKESDEDGGGKDDEDFAASATEEESEGAMEDVVDDEEVDGGEQNDSGDDFEAPRTRRVQKRNRKPPTQRTRRRTRNRRQSKRKQTEDKFANEIEKSYRPMNDSLRRSDFYRERDASSDSSFSAGEEPGASPGTRSRRPPRVAATRASASIANNVDFLQNPMAIADVGKPSRPKRTERYPRHRGRWRPSGADPFMSDDDSLANVSAAPIEPIRVDMNLSWDDIGGLDSHVRALKEMVVLPLLYPEVFEKFSMEPPKGVLFYGPPGTGKTLCARALAASCGADMEVVDNCAEADPAKITSKSPEKSTTGGKDVVGVEDATPGDVRIPLSATADGSFREAKVSEPSAAAPNSETLNSVLETVQSQPRDDEADAGPEKDDRGGNMKDQRDAPKSVADAPVDDTSTLPGSKNVKKKPRVAFFMRNGADCLSKWVGEAERQLRMTFEAAKKHQPAIIFFDEIDGLAPVRSSRQDQIHSSIVSTLLGLMDGLEARGQIVVIGATNRVDAIDPALRRPGRFDREMIFTLPNITARRKILDIHTNKWKPAPKPPVLDTVASMTVGYCGADLKALCSESAIRALRRRYPQIYQSNDKLLIDINQVKVKRRDFVAAMSEIVPASHRSATTFARPLPSWVAPVLDHVLRSCIRCLKDSFPMGLSTEALKYIADNESDATNAVDDINNGGSSDIDDDDVTSSDDDETMNVDAMQSQISNAGRIRAQGSNQALMRHRTFRPRMLVCGDQGLGQGHLGPAILHLCEGCPVHAVDFTTLHADLGSRSPEEALVTAFREAARSVPSILYLPHLQMWWTSASQTLQTTLILALKDLPSDLPLLVLATAEDDLQNLPPEIHELFPDVQLLSAPTEDMRRRLFAPVMEEAQARPKVSDMTARRRRLERAMEVLPKAPPITVAKTVNANEEQKQFEHESRYLRMLRMEMRSFVESLLRDRRYKPFWTPVDPTSAPDYYEIIRIPMDISKIAANVDKGAYPTVLAMVNDFDIMVKNAIQYNPPNTEIGAAILRRAHGLIDIVYAWVDNLNTNLVETCNKIVADRIERSKTKQSVCEAACGRKKEGQSVPKLRSVEEEEREAAAGGEVENGGKVEIQKEKCVDGSKAKEEDNKEADVMEVDVMEDGTDDESNQPGPARLAVRTVVEEGAGGRADKEVFVQAKEGQVRELERMLVDVSSGMGVDALEVFLLRCDKVLRTFRTNMNRIAAVRALVSLVDAARYDPALVGKLVA